MFKGKKCYAIILAGGESRRFGGNVSKTLQMLNEKPIIVHSLVAFQKNEFIDEIYAVVNSVEGYDFEGWIANFGLTKFKNHTKGGQTRQESSKKGLEAVQNAQDDSIILIHDGARPFVSQEIINNIIADAFEYGAAAPGLKVTDTIKKAKDGFFVETLEREHLYSIQTPQGFHYSIINKSHTQNLWQNLTDDAALVEKLGIKIKIVESNSNNIKITYKSDLELIK